MRVLANDSEFGTKESLECYDRLDNEYLKYLKLADQFTALLQLVIVEDKDTEQIPEAITNFLHGLHTYKVRGF